MGDTEILDMKPAIGLTRGNATHHNRPEMDQDFSQPTENLQRLVPLWAHAIHDWAHIIGRDPYGRPYFPNERELRWVNPAPSHNHYSMRSCTYAPSDPPRM